MHLLALSLLLHLPCQATQTFPMTSQLATPGVPLSRVDDRFAHRPQDDEAGCGGSAHGPVGGGAVGHSAVRPPTSHANIGTAEPWGAGEMRRRQGSGLVWQRGSKNLDDSRGNSEWACQDGPGALAGGDHRSFMIKGDSLKQAVELRCFKGGERAHSAHEQRRRLLMATLSRQTLGNVSIVLDGDPHHQEKALKDAIAGAVAEALWLVVADEDFDRAGESGKLLSSASDGYRSQCSAAVTHIRTLSSQSDLTSTSASGHSQGFASDGTWSSSGSLMGVNSGTGRNHEPGLAKGMHTHDPNTPKVLNIQEFQCFFCGIRGSKAMVRSKGQHHGLKCPKAHRGPVGTVSNVGVTHHPDSQPIVSRIHSPEKQPHVATPPVTHSIVAHTAKVFEALASTQNTSRATSSASDGARDVTTRRKMSNGWKPSSEANQDNFPWIFYQQVSGPVDTEHSMNSSNTAHPGSGFLASGLRGSHANRSSTPPKLTNILGLQQSEPGEDDMLLDDEIALVQTSSTELDSAHTARSSDSEGSTPHLAWGATETPKINGFGTAAVSATDARRYHGNGSASVPMARAAEMYFCG